MITYTNINNSIAKKAGIKCAILLSILQNRQDYFLKSKQFESEVEMIDEKPFVYTTQNYVEELIGMTPREQRAAREKLKEIGLVEEKRTGVLGRLHFYVNEDKLNEYTEENEPKFDKGYKPVSFVVVNKVAATKRAQIKAPNAIPETNEKEHQDITEGHTKTLQNVTPRCDNMSHQEVTKCNIKMLQNVTSKSDKMSHHTLYNNKYNINNYRENSNTKYTTEEKKENAESIALSFDFSNSIFKDFYEVWNKNIDNFDKVEKPTLKIDANIRQLTGNGYGINDFLTVCIKANKSTFLTEKFTGMSMAWATVPTNFKKILEGNYDNGGRNANLPPQAGLSGWIPLPQEEEA